MKINFNEPAILGKEIEYIKDAILNHKKISGDGFYTAKCREFFKKFYRCEDALITHSCTAALEMAAILLDLKDGDEVIMPSYTFVSTANAFVLRGAVPVFVDIRSDTLNIDEKLIEAAITPKTKAICVVHYAGIAAEMDVICAIAKKHSLAVIEDAAQALGSKYKGRNLGSIGEFGALSFHETKNIISGEGGALIINDAKYRERAEVIREKGTNRTKFFKGEVDKYTWVDVGSSYLPSDIISAYLYAQLENLDKVTAKRKEVWDFYKKLFTSNGWGKIVTTPEIPADCESNYHIFFVIFKTAELRSKFIKFCKEKGVMAIFHYIPLHTSPAGIKFARIGSGMEVTNSLSERIVRMPLHMNIGTAEMAHISEVASDFLKNPA